MTTSRTPTLSPWWACDQGREVAMSLLTVALPSHSHIPLRRGGASDLSPQRHIRSFAHPEDMRPKAESLTEGPCPPARAPMTHPRVRHGPTPRESMAWPAKAKRVTGLSEVVITHAFHGERANRHAGPARSIPTRRWRPRPARVQSFGVPFEHREGSQMRITHIVTTFCIPWVSYVANSRVADASAVFIHPAPSPRLRFAVLAPHQDSLPHHLLCPPILPAPDTPRKPV